MGFLSARPSQISVNESWRKLVRPYTKATILRLKSAESQAGTMSSCCFASPDSTDSAVGST